MLLSLFMLSCLFGGADAVQLRVCLIQIRDQQINPQRQLAVGQSPGGRDGGTGFVSESGSGVHCAGT